MATPNTGLYDPTYQRDACGFGFVARVDGRPTRETVEVLAERPELTDQGRALVAGMATTLAGWSTDPVSPTARAEAELARLREELARRPG